MARPGQSTATHANAHDVRTDRVRYRIPSSTLATLKSELTSTVTWVASSRVSRVSVIP